MAVNRTGASPVPTIHRVAWLRHTVALGRIVGTGLAPVLLTVTFTLTKARYYYVDAKKHMHSSISFLSHNLP